MSDLIGIAGPRLTLRDWREADLEPFERWMQPGQRWQAFDGPYYPRPSPTQVREQSLARRADTAIVALQRLLRQRLVERSEHKLDLKALLDVAGDRGDHIGLLG